MGREEQGSVERESLATTDSTRMSDPRDDWLGQGRGGDLEWFPDAPSTGQAPRPPGGEADRRSGPEQPPSRGTIRRRREIAIVVAVVLLVVVAIVAIVAVGGTGGGGSPATTATTPPATTP